VSALPSAAVAVVAHNSFDALPDPGAVTVEHGLAEFARLVQVADGLQCGDDTVVLVAAAGREFTLG